MAFSLVPYQRLQLRSPRSAEEVRDRLAAAVEPARWLRNPFSRSHQPYEGRVTLNTFQIQRIIHYRNAFNPVLIGEVVALPEGCSVSVVIRSEPAIALFLILWLGWVFGTGVRPEAAVPTLILLFVVYVASLAAFRFEAEKSRRFLGDILN